MNKKYKFHELVSKVTVDPLDDSDVAKSMLGWDAKVNLKEWIR